MQPQHIISLQAENIKRLTAVKIDINPADGTVIITGDNGAGKSSVIDAICAAIGGGDFKIEDPVRHGKESAKVILKTEDLIITKKFSSAGGVFLEVTNAEGMRHPSPQKVLDSLYARVGFDPLAFAAMDAKSQATTLLKLCPTKLDLNQNAALYKGEYEARRDANRDLQRLETQLASIPAPAADTPTQEVSISALTTELAKVQSDANAMTGKRTTQKQFEAHVVSLQKQIEEVEARLDHLKKQKADENSTIEKLVSELSKAPDLMPQIDSLQKQIAAAEETNRKVRTAQERVQFVSNVEKAKVKAQEHDANLEKLKTERESALKEAKFPVDGLAIDQEGQVIFNGVLLSQASTAEKIRIGVALAAASNPTLKVAFIRDGSTLDKKSMAAVAELAKTHNLNIWIERVEDASPTAIRIEEGSNIGAKDAPDEKVEIPQLDPSLPVPAVEKKRGRKPKTDDADMFRA